MIMEQNSCFLLVMYSPTKVWIIFYFCVIFITQTYQCPLGHELKNVGLQMYLEFYKRFISREKRELCTGQNAECNTQFVVIPKILT